MNARRLLRAACIAVTAWAPLASQAAEIASFQRDVVPILKARCVACHLTGEEPGGMALHPGAAYRSLVGVPAQTAKLQRVRPGSPHESYLVHKLQGTHLDVGGSGLRMPMDGVPLTPEQIEIIRAWISAGAPQN